MPHVQRLQWSWVWIWPVALCCTSPPSVSLIRIHLWHQSLSKSGKSLHWLSTATIYSLNVHLSIVRMYIWNDMNLSSKICDNLNNLFVSLLWPFIVSSEEWGLHNSSLRLTRDQTTEHRYKQKDPILLYLRLFSFSSPTWITSFSFYSVCTSTHEQNQDNVKDLLQWKGEMLNRNISVSVTCLNECCDLCWWAVGSAITKTSSRITHIYVLAN